MGFWNAKCRSTARLDGKTVVVTGCNTGIGKKCVKDFYLRGAQVIMACRSLEKANDARLEIEETCKYVVNIGTMRTVQLDLTNLKSVRKCAEEINATVKKIDVLLNNAGIMACPYMKTEDNFEIQLGTNHLGHFLFTLLLLPKIIASDSQPARIVNVSSMAHLGGRINFDDLNWEKRRYSSTFAYSQSKLANILFTKELARRLKDAGIDNVHTYSLHPGIIKTELGRYMDDAYFKGCTNVFKIFTSLYKTPKQGAQTSIYCSVSEKCAKDTGLYYQECHEAWCTWNAKNKEDAGRLWEKSLKLTGLDINFNLSSLVHK